MPRVLCLDFDGVLHRAGNGVEDVGPTFIWLPLLAEALAPFPDVAICVHSTWRYQYSVREIQELLSSLEPRIITAAPRGPRAEAIRWFLHTNPNFVSHRVLDDDESEFGPDAPKELILCDPSLGLTTPDVMPRLRSWLSA